MSKAAPGTQQPPQKACGTAGVEVRAQRYEVLGSLQAEDLVAASSAARKSSAWEGAQHLLHLGMDLNPRCPICFWEGVSS